jgi:hypothetical protein
MVTESYRPDYKKGYQKASTNILGSFRSLVINRTSFFILMVQQFNTKEVSFIFNMFLISNRRTSYHKTLSMRNAILCNYLNYY